jgi:hypothetical protein
VTGGKIATIVFHTVDLKPFSEVFPYAFASLGLEISYSLSLFVFLAAAALVIPLEASLRGMVGRWYGR